MSFKILFQGLQIFIGLKKMGRAYNCICRLYQLLIISTCFLLRLVDFQNKLFLFFLALLFHSMLGISNFELAKHRILSHHCF